MQNREVSAQNFLMGFLNTCMLDRCDSTRKNEDFIKIMYYLIYYLVYNMKYIYK